MQKEISSDRLKVVIDSFGAEICSIKNDVGTEYIWSADKELWGRHAPVLFPIVGRLRNNVYNFDNRQYALGQHGFARDMAFNLTKESGNSCTFQLCASEETKKAYPFDFIFEVGYVLLGNKLKCFYKVNNAGKGPLFFSVGAHPGFNCPLMKGEAFEDYYLEFESDSLIQTTLSAGLTSGRKALQIRERKLFLSEALFAEDALVFENHQINKVKLCSTKSSAKIEIACKDWPFFGIWTKKGSSRFICLEPWYGIADGEKTNQNLSEKTGILKLEGGGEFECSFSIEIT